ncbi:hypothetical protein P3342_005306 [Pyrenophora teres f. teres]|nr:hypothetical protein P3342_005306 [Pyrenophora teres f. teres]
MTGYSDASTFDTGAPEKESTDSSSYQSTRDSAVRRSRSGSSSDASCASPALPIASPAPKPRHHSMPTRYMHKELTAAPSYIFPSRPGTGTRTSSLPTLHVGHVESHGQNKRHSTSSQHHQHSDMQRARLESLAALTAERPLSFTHRHNKFPHAMSSTHRPSVSSRPRPHSYHKSPPQPLSTPPPTQSRYYPKSTSPNTLEKRAVPRRETLTQWKAERDEAKMEFYGIRRASMKERVRRANELEHEREEELVKMGKGTGEKGDCDEDEDDDDGEGGAGCFGGILGMFRTGR